MTTNEKETTTEKGICATCGNEFPKKRSDGRFCGKPCRDKYFRGVSAERRRGKNPGKKIRKSKQEIVPLGDRLKPLQIVDDTKTNILEQLRCQLERIKTTIETIEAL